jgi:hypothetical protein
VVNKTSGRSTASPGTADHYLVEVSTADYNWVGATSKNFENQNPAATVDHSIPTFTLYKIAYESPINYY